MKKYLVFGLVFFAASAVAVQSPSHDAPKPVFCSIETGFPKAVEEGCESKSKPASFCQNTTGVYNAMRAYYTIAKKSYCDKNYHGDWLLCSCADAAGGGTLPQECKNQWNCYMYGTTGSGDTAVSTGTCFSQAKIPPLPCNS